MTDTLRTGNRMVEWPFGRAETPSVVSFSWGVEHHALIAASAEAVWNLLGRQFATVAEWASAFRRSEAVPVRAGSRVANAPVEARVCTPASAVMPTIRETLVSYDEANRTLTYEATGLPSIISKSLNTWTVTPLRDDSSRLALYARIDMNGLLGTALRPVVLAQVKRLFASYANDLQHYVLHGSPSPEKQRQLAQRSARPLT